MKGKYRIFYITPEIAPFNSSSPIANISGTLPKILKNLGHDIRVMMPKYGNVNERKYVLRDVIRLRDMQVDFADKSYSVNAKSAFLPDSKVQVYFLDHAQFSSRNGSYRDKPGNASQLAEVERFILFNHGCLQTLRSLHWQPEFILCNGWPAIFLPLILRHELADDAFFARTHIVFCDHSDSIQVELSLEQMKDAGLYGEFLSKYITTDQKVGVYNIAKSVCDAIVYSTQQQSVEKFGQFEKFISHGIDYQDWNPAGDEKIAEKFSVENSHLKIENKKIVCDDFDLEFDEEIPLASLLVDDNTQAKRLDDLINIFNQMQMQTIILGSSSVTAFEDMDKEVTETVRLKVDPSAKVRHQIVAGSDMCLQLSSESHIVESRFLQNMKYGTIGVIPESSISGFKPETHTILQDLPLWGQFNLKKISTLKNALQKMCDDYRNHDHWRESMLEAMKIDFSLMKSGEQYTELFNSL